MSSVSTDTRVSVPKTFLNVRDISDISDPIFRMSIDLVAASRRQLSFLRLVSESHWLHNKPTLLQAIRRYDELWMPLLSDLGDDESNPPMVLPPFDVQWVWHCHTLNPASYRLYCESRFSKMLQKPLIFDDENEDYGLNRCRDIWDYRYPFEPFELEPRNGNTEEVDIIRYKDIFDEVSKNRYLYSMFSEPYMLEMVYLIVAKQRYKGFLCMLQRYRDGCSRFVPTLDIQLMWLTHKSYPLIYAEDVKEMVGDLGKVAGVWDSMKEEEVEATKKIWERIFYQPYEKAGATLNKIVVGLSKPPAYWEVSGIDVNTKYKSLQPRFLQEVCVFVRGESGNRESQSLKKKNHDEFLCLRAVRCHKEFKLSKPITSIPSDTWGKMWHLICEFNTRGITLELVQSSSSCLERSKSLSTITFVWNDLLRAPSLILERELEQHLMAVASVTPPIQAPYLLKCVPDRVTDDSGAMISEVILKRNQYRPQEGRWLSRSVLDHAGHECFVVRIRVGSGFWRRGGEAPSSVKLTERIVEIREGSWSYVAGSIGVAPGKVVGTATPKDEESPESQASWSLSTGDELILQWDSSGLTFHLQSQSSANSVRLLNGRQFQYQVNEVDSKSKEKDDEESFVTLVRYSPDTPNGRATALINWKLFVVEFLPEEDAILVLLISMIVLISASEMAREDLGNLLVRRRLKEVKLGQRDWGSVILHPSCSSSTCSPHLQPWHFNARAVTSSVEMDDTRHPTFNYSPSEGGDKLYKQGILRTKT